MEGREAPDYARLLPLAGYALRTADPGRAWLGNVNVGETSNGLVVGGGGGGRSGDGGSPLVPFNTPLYDAGVDSGDTIRSIDGQPATLGRWNAISNRKPGDRVMLVVMRRDGATVTKALTLKSDPTAQQVVSMDNPTAAQTAFRQAWLASRVR